MAEIKTWPMYVIMQLHVLYTPEHMRQREVVIALTPQ
jgi:hypothetical protein